MDIQKENQLLASGYKFICGIDEAGRGPLAGPIVAAAVILDFGKIDALAEINDSKKLTAEKREALFPVVTKNVLSWAVGVVASHDIDANGISYANKLVMQRACDYLNPKPNYVLVDYMPGVYFKMPFELVAHGDARILSIAAASIIAKVIHDRMMRAFARKYPQYGFDEHMGYGTDSHLQKIQEFGPCPIHRQSYGPMKSRLF